MCARLASTEPTWRGLRVVYAVALAKYTPEATKALIEEGPVARAAYFKALIEGRGGQVLGYFFAEGSEADVVSLMALPDEMRADPAANIATQALNWSAGWAESIRVIWLSTPEAFEAALTAATGVAAPGNE